MNGPFELPPLPYPKAALEPHISAETLKFHHGKHHKAYIEKLNKAVAGTKLEDMELEDVVVASSKDRAARGREAFHNAAQAWNHGFYWRCMKPGGGGEPSGKLADRMRTDFGGIAGFAQKFQEAANGQFGSGWAWLVLEGGKLRVVKTSNADTPIARKVRPLLVIDVWEHAYYLDYQNERPKYAAAFVENLIDWDFAAENLRAAQGSTKRAVRVGRTAS